MAESTPNTSRYGAVRRGDDEKKKAQLVGTYSKRPKKKDEPINKKNFSAYVYSRVYKSFRAVSAFMRDLKRLKVSGEPHRRG